MFNFIKRWVFKDVASLPEIPNVTWVKVLPLSDELVTKIEEYSEKYGITKDEVVQQIFKLGMLVEHVESRGGKFGIKNVSDKKIQYLSFMKHLNDKKQVSRILEEVLKGIDDVNP